MIETHVVNAVLDVSLRESLSYRVLTFINGLVAPSFLFCAGVAFTIAFHRKWNEYVSLTSVFWKYIARLLFILVIAYTLHFPVFSFRQMLSIEDERSWMIFFQSDILHVIALTLISLAVMAVIVRRERYFIVSAAAVGLFIIFLSPIIRGQDYSGYPIWLRPFFNTEFKSQFPLFPWSAFLICGVLVGQMYVRSRELGREQVLMKRLMVGSVVMIGAALVAEFIPITIYPNHDFWRASPEFFFVRFGLVTLALFLVWKYEQVRSVSPRSVLTLFGKESLVVYVAHLLIVYGYTFEFSFTRMYGKTLAFWQCFLLTIGLTILMYGLALGWNTLKHTKMKWAKLVQAGVVAGTAIYFFMK